MGKKKKELLHSKKPKKLGGTDWGVFFREKTRYLPQKDAYVTVINLAIKEYALSTDGVVKELRFDHIQDKFMAKVIYVDTR